MFILDFLFYFSLPLSFINSKQVSLRGCIPVHKQIRDKKGNYTAVNLIKNLIEELREKLNKKKLERHTS